MLRVVTRKKEGEVSKELKAELGRTTSTHRRYSNNKDGDDHP